MMYFGVVKPNSHLLLIDDAGALMTLNCIYMREAAKERETENLNAMQSAIRAHKVTHSNANEAKLNDL